MVFVTMPIGLKERPPAAVEGSVPGIQLFSQLNMVHLFPFHPTFAAQIQRYDRSRSRQN
jgi:hypothetical protein